MGLAPSLNSREHDLLIKAHDGLADIEPAVRYNREEAEWQAPSDEGRWEYVSPEWLDAWFTRCGYVGYRRLFSEGPWLSPAPFALPPPGTARSS